jgi:putative ABC transport system permease protein
MQSLRDTLSQVFRAIWASKLRSFLTMFGIAWGVGSMLLLIGMGEGFRSGQHKQLSKLGNDLIMNWGGTIPALPNQHTGMRPYRPTLGDEEEMRQSPSIRAVTAILSHGDIKQVSQYASAGGQVMGVEPNFPVVRFLPMKDGRFIDRSDMDERRKVIVLGKKSAELLFPGRPAIGEFITLNGTRFLVIGIAGNISRGNNDSDNQKCYVPLTTMIQMFPIVGANLPLDAVSSLQYQPRVRGENAAAVAAAHAILGRRHGFDPSLVEAFDEWDTIKEEHLIGKIFDAMDVFLGGVGVVTLALGAVGIINIMLVSVTERTREIGLCKAIGATNTSIMMQFFLEGIFLTGVSGLIGILGAAGLMSLLQKVVGEGLQGFDPPRLVPWSAALAMGSLALSGIIAGLYPARKAAMLEPVEALRRE